MPDLSTVDERASTRYGADMDISLTRDQEIKLGALARSTGKDQGELISEAVDRLLEYDRWFHEQVRVGLDQLAKGEFIEDDEVGNSIDRVLASS